MSDAGRPRAAAFVSVTQRMGLTLLLHPDAPRWVVLNPVGLAVARLCDGTRTTAEIAAEIAGRWAQPVARVLDDVEACVTRLAEAGFLDDLTPDPSPARRGVDAAPPSLAGKGAGGLGDLPPWRLHLYITESCNLRCRHCGTTGDGTASPLALAGARKNGAYYLRPSQPQTINDGAFCFGRRPEKRGVLSPTEPASRAVSTHLDAALVRDLIDQAVASGAEGVAFGGGEPLLQRELLELLAYAAPRLKTLLATNAVLLDDAAAETLARLGVIVQVSLDGPDAATHDRIRGAGAFERAWRGIERLQRAGIGERLALNVTLMRPNIGLLTEIVALAERCGIASVRFTALQRMGRAAEQWADLAPAPAQSVAAYRYLYRCRPPVGAALSPGLLGLELEPPDQGMWCGLGRTLLVDARGDIYPCGLFVGPEFCLGNVRDTRLADALASEELAQLIARCAARRDEIPECRTCAWKRFCQGGCAGSVWQLHGTLGATDGLCEVRRELFSVLLLETSLREVQS